jgi:hypothetical protein
MIAVNMMVSRKRRMRTLTGSIVVIGILVLGFTLVKFLQNRPLESGIRNLNIARQGPVMMNPALDGSSNVGTIYKKITFSELPPGINNNSRIKQFLGTRVAKQIIDPGRNSNDSTVVMDGDTVWQVIINPFPARTSGCSWYAEMQLNGRNDRDDTLTYGMFTYYLKLSSNWDWANGGKLIGLAGKDASGAYPPGGGVRGPDCNTPADYELDHGFSMRGGFDFEDKWQSSGGEIGFYVYHQGFQFNECKVHYGDTWNSRRTHGIDMTWEFDKWYKITHRIVLNSPGNYDGMLEWYRNDTCYMARDSIKFRNYEHITLDYFMLETFQGGDKVPGYQGATVWYDDLILWSDQDRSFHGLGYVMNYTPEMPSQNVLQ